MKLIKWLIVFAVAFVAAWILIFTFIQPPFKVVAAAQVFKWSGPAIPIYLYVAGAFGIGFGLGIIVALYNYFSLQFKLRHKIKECVKMEEKLSEATMRIEWFEAAETSKSAFVEKIPGVAAITGSTPKSSQSDEGIGQ